jgi:hypothetical protein
LAPSFNDNPVLIVMIETIRQALPAACADAIGGPCSCA